MKHFTNIASTLFGYFAKCRFPQGIQHKINRYYVDYFKVDLAQFAPLEQYESLNALFTRRLVNKREICSDKDSFISPCDALITQMGTLEGDRALQIKDRSYSVATLLTPYTQLAKDSTLFKQGCFINFYLSPKDYHCYHAPCDMLIHRAIHVPGKLYPVNLKFLYKQDELFNHNERVILECTHKGRFFYLVFVGALNVGSMRFSFDDSITTNKDDAIRQYLYEDITLDKGAYLGNFEMGSTIVLIAQKGMLQPTVVNEQSVRFGDNIATLIA